VYIRLNECFYFGFSAFISGRVDVDRVGVAGHSFGGMRMIDAEMFPLVMYLCVHRDSWILTTLPHFARRSDGSKFSNP
jgi:hypothetical protein